MDERIGFLIKCLALIVYRHGGELVIENQSDLNGEFFDLSFDLDEKHDRATLRLKPRPNEAGVDWKNWEELM